MSDATIAILDPFEPAILDVIKAAMPPTWSINVTEEASHQGLANALRDADAAFVIAAPLSGELLYAAPRLGFIQKLGAGVDRIDLSACSARGIGLARLYAGNAIPVAEHTIMLMLAAYRRLPQLDRLTREGAWAKEDCRAINRHMYSKTVGIIGMGAIGREVSARLANFGVNILYNDPVRPPSDIAKKLKIRYSPLDELLTQSDIVSLHLPLTDETADLLNERQIASMKPGAVLINCARGGLVDEMALARALEGGHLFAAALDTFSVEPPKGSPLLELENVILSPHCAGATFDNISVIATRAVQNTKLFLASEPLPKDDVWIAPRPRVTA